MVHARWALVTALVMLLSMCDVVCLAAPPQASLTFQDSIRPFLAQHCFSCHNVDLNAGGLNLEAFATPESRTKDGEKWELVLQKLQSGEMPPKGLPRPSETGL